MSICLDFIVDFQIRMSICPDFIVDFQISSLTCLSLYQADVESRPVYLESSSIANNTYYSRFGFELKRDISLIRGPAPIGLSIMVREPQTALHKKLIDEE